MTQHPEAIHGLRGVVHVVYSVPVIAVVDLDEGTVDRVVVIDEEVELTQDVNLDDGATPAPDDIVVRARDIAETDVWPHWEFGF